jgi:hypothetical protein
VKKKNPVLEKARKEGYEMGFKVGYENGRKAGQMDATYTFAEKWKGLEKVPGIGPMMFERIIKHFGKEYFQRQGAKK